MKRDATPTYCWVVLTFVTGAACRLAVEGGLVPLWWTLPGMFAAACFALVAVLGMLGVFHVRVVGRGPSEPELAAARAFLKADDRRTAWEQVAELEQRIAAELRVGEGAQRKLGRTPGEPANDGGWWSPTPSEYAAMRRQSVPQSSRLPKNAFGEPPRVTGKPAPEWYVNVAVDGKVGTVLVKAHNEQDALAKAMARFPGSERVVPFGSKRVRRPPGKR